MPGGAEALVNPRDAIERTIRASPKVGIWAVIDVDFQNAFLSILHEAIDSALETKVPDLRPKSRWCQDNCGVFFLTFPRKALCPTERGAL